MLTVFLLHSHRHKPQLAKTSDLFHRKELLAIMAPCMRHQLCIGKVSARLLQYLMCFGERCQACNASASAGSLTCKTPQSAAKRKFHYRSSIYPATRRFATAFASCQATVFNAMIAFAVFAIGRCVSYCPSLAIANDQLGKFSFICNAKAPIAKARISGVVILFGKGSSGRTLYYISYD